MRIRRLSRPFAAVLLALALAFAAVPARAQSSAPAPAAAQAPGAGPANVPAATAGQSLRRTTLPADAEPAPPRTMRAYAHVFIAFTIAWIALFGYALSVGRRFRKLEAEVEALRATA